jgi:beta-glucosidase-like glycosyl hydrolase
MKKTLALIMAVVILLGLCATAFAYDIEYTAEEVEANAKELALQLSEEGIVMLKNDNDVLPLKAEDGAVKVNVFGTCALDMVASGGRSGSTGSGMNFYTNLATAVFSTTRSCTTQ